MKFPAQFAESRVFRKGYDELMFIVQTALNKLGWQFVILSGNQYQASVSGNFLSFGEIVKIEIHSDGSVSAESRCVFPFQLFDWGKNKKNVRLFFEELERILGTK